MAHTPKFAKAEIKHLKETLEPLVGAKVVAVDATYVDMNVWPFLVLELNGREIMLQAVRDSEVNGPGAFLFKEI